jgi:hypothetical protein
VVGEYAQSDRGKAGFQILLSSKALFSDLIQMSPTGCKWRKKMCETSILTYSRDHGLFGGVSLDGSTFVSGQ